MRLLITTGIFDPESGGPATYARELATMLIGESHQVTVLTYSAQAHYDFDTTYPFHLIRIVRGNKILNRLRFFWAVFCEIKTVDCVYTLDWFAAGLPVAFACILRAVPYVVRVGGDYLWEQSYLQSGRTPISLREFYEAGVYKEMRYRTVYVLIHLVLNHARHVIFNSDVQRELYLTHYSLPKDKTSTSYNPMPAMQKNTQDIVRSEFVYWGRLIVMKNVTTLVGAFAQAQLPKEYTLTIIGDGPQKKEIQTLIIALSLEGRVQVLPAMRHSKVLARVSAARAFVLPSWTDIAPNQVYEALSLGLPTLVTRENYLPIHDQLPSMIDPHSVEDIASKLEMLADDGQYTQFKKTCRNITHTHPWEEVIREIMPFLQK